MNKYRDLILIISGLLLSQFLVMLYNVHGEFIFHEFRIRAGSLFSINASSPQLFVTSSVAGYCLFLTFLLIHYKNKSARASRVYDITLLSITLAIFYELRSLYLDLFGLYKGERVQAGIIFFLLCIFVYRKIYYERAAVKTLHEQNGHDKELSNKINKSSE
jgi:hypothetical protein